MCMIFTKMLFSSVTISFLKIKLFIQNKYLYPLSKNLILLKKISFCKKMYSDKQTHSAKDKFYFQFSFATNEQVSMMVKKYKYFFQILLL